MLGEKKPKDLLIYLLAGTLIILAFLARVYRLNDLLGFYYDQGRDGLVIWDFLHQGKPFLIGPTTGIEGIFRGPWYYWLITPFYFLGRGDPIYPATFLVVTTLFSLFVLYKLGERLSGRLTGLIAVVIAGFSYYLISASRWLSNPTPMFLISVLLVYSLFLILEGKKWAWLLVTFLLGMAMQFGSAAEVFYFLAVGVFAVWQRKNLPGRKILGASISVFFLTFLPQIIFDIRHQGILSSALKRFLFEEQSFKIPFWEILQTRLPFYFNVFASKIFPFDKVLAGVTFVITGAILWFKRKEIFKNKYFLTLLILLISPLIGMLFFQGNYGNTYDYYFTGYFLIFVSFFSHLLTYFAKKPLGKAFLAVFLALFLVNNISPLKKDLSFDLDDPKAIVLANEKRAIDWIYQDAAGVEFNVDIYVPPVIPYAYDYLFKWYGATKFGKEPVEKRVILLYTLSEMDFDHPERLKAWLERQAGIGKVVKEERFGGIVVQKRERF